MVINCQKSIFKFSHIPKKIKIEFEITKNRIELFEIIKNWIENCQKINFQIFSLSQKLKNEMDVFVHGCGRISGSKGAFDFSFKMK